MYQSAQSTVVRRLYEARGDVEILREVIAPDAEWDVAEGFPNGGLYQGFDAVVNDFFAFMREFAEFRVVGEEFFEDGDHVIVLGSYHGVTKEGGNKVVSRFVHVCTIRDGRIARMQQTADTLPIARALGR